ncbi:VOC family protein [Streptomyces flavofungini]|uniref:VOC family protein n=1 Tax=Streptomyces flavofungini TaxID=68200 RepID=A0ABS0XEQ4_9ACTN|nr:VOC family protein [Streptomyces flavofungini]MBJ3811709.1 VOC family protein [Streptomyces flavofungini]GHC86958.1 glyoxalase [Streptomyces flavofungini]
MPDRPAVHLAIPVDDLAAARGFYGQILGLSEGRSTDHWIDWDFDGHQLVTHLVAQPSVPAGLSSVERHVVPVPHFGLLLTHDRFCDLADRLRAAEVPFDIEPCLRYAGEPAEQWTMFLRDHAGNALEFKAFTHESAVFAR